MNLLSAKVLSTMKIKNKNFRCFMLKLCFLRCDCKINSAASYEVFSTFIIPLPGNIQKFVLITATTMFNLLRFLKLAWKHLTLLFFKANEIELLLNRCQKLREYQYYQKNCWKTNFENWVNALMPKSYSMQLLHQDIVTNIAKKKTTHCCDFQLRVFKV